MKLPLDYFTGTYTNETVSIAITKLPAKVKVDHPQYGGPILLNPGGPGGGGTSFALIAGEQIRTIVDSDKYFDIIGFDPRGIGESAPLAECLPDDPSAWSWGLREYTEGILGSSDAALGRLWAMNHAYGSACKQTMDHEDGPDIKQYSSTASVARDMLEIVERHAEYVTREVNRITTQEAVYAPGEAKLQYWGFSYGTYLGATFATMFPDRVGRVALDGVVDSWDYIHALGNGSLYDTEKTMRSFFTFCQLAGPDDCALAVVNGSITDIENRFHKIVESLYHKPLIINSGDGVPEILTYSDIRLLVFAANYAPEFSWPQIAWWLAEVEAGGGEWLEQLAKAYRYRHIYQCPIDGYPPQRLASAGVATLAILCGDGLDLSDLSIDEFTDIWKDFQRISPTAGSIWASIGMHCVSWKIRAKYTFQGPFGGETANPVLFISNTADPVTPLRSGRIMHKKFSNSGLLISDSAGHCSISTVNPCAMAHIREYFRTGLLPPTHTVCIPPPSYFSLNSTDPNSPFYDPSLGEANVMHFEEDVESCEQRTLMAATRSLRRQVAMHDSFGFQKLVGGERLQSAMKLLN